VEKYNFPMIRQMKAYTINDPDEFQDWTSQWCTNSFIVSTKYDGRYIQGYVFNGKVMLMTRNGLIFNMPHFRWKLLRTNLNFFFEAELVWKKGLLGDRDKTAILTTWINYGKEGVDPQEFDGYSIKLIRTLPIEEKSGKVKFLLGKPYIKLNDRVAILPDWALKLNMLDWVDYRFKTPDEILHQYTVLKEEGIEGLMVMPYNLPYRCGKRVKDYVKLKPIFLVKVKVVGYLDGEGKYEGRIGSLIVQTEGKFSFSVAGIPDSWRNRRFFKERVAGKELNIQYERFDKTYVQPRIYNGKVKEEYFI